MIQTVCAEADSYERMPVSIIRPLVHADNTRWIDMPCRFFQGFTDNGIHQAIMSATRYIRNVLFYEGPTTQNFNPQVFIDISDTLDQKVKALQAHRSQVMKTNIEDLSIVEVARSSANFRGIQGRVKYAEAFHALRLFINI